MSNATINKATGPRWHRVFAIGHRCPSSFTLLELLTTVAIIAILLTLLLSTLSQAKARARNVACASQLKQWGLVLQLYLQEWDRYPSFAGEDAIGTHPEKGLAQLNSNLIWCPERAFVKDWQLWVQGRYGYNCWGTSPSLGLEPYPRNPQNPEEGWIYLHESDVQSPADMIAVGDNDLGWKARFTISPTASSWFFWPGQLHSSGGNMVFCDGHVEYNLQTNWMVPNERARRRWNYDNQPHPETWVPYSPF